MISPVSPTVPDSDETSQTTTSTSTKKAAKTANKNGEAKPPAVQPVTEKAAPAAAADVKIELNENASLVLEKRYLRKDNQGKPCETPEELFHRVAHHIASAEMNYGSDIDQWENNVSTLL